MVIFPALWQSRIFLIQGWRIKNLSVQPELHLKLSTLYANYFAFLLISVTLISLFEANQDIIHNANSLQISCPSMGLFRLKFFGIQFSFIFLILSGISYFGACCFLYSFDLLSRFELMALRGPRQVYLTYFHFFLNQHSESSAFSQKFPSKSQKLLTM